MEKDIELKPCPICGSEVNMIEENVGEYTVVCHGCQVLMIADDVSSKDDAIERWNNRVNEPEWILIKDRKPDNGQLCVIVTKIKIGDESSYHYDIGMWHSGAFRSFTLNTWIKFENALWSPVPSKVS